MIFYVCFTGHQKDTCREVTRYTFTDTQRWVSECSPKIPIEELFKKRYTNLVIVTCTKPNTGGVKEVIRDHLLRLKKRHNGHDQELRIKAKCRITENYLVADNNKRTPFVLKPSVFWTFTFLGLSLPLRLVQFCVLHEITFTIKKHVFSVDYQTLQEITCIHIPPYPETFPNFNFSTRAAPDSPTHKWRTNVIDDTTSLYNAQRDRTNR